MAGSLMRTVKGGRKLTASLLLLFCALPVLGLCQEKSQLEAMYDKAFQDLNASKYDEALKELDGINMIQPDLAEAWNLRGVVFMRKADYAKAESALRKALSIEPKFWNARFNLAEIPFLKKDWPEARNRFEGLMTADNPDLQPEAAQLIQYKIFLTLILQGKKTEIDWMLSKLGRARQVAALYYSNAAIAFEQGKQKEAAAWVSEAKKRFPDNVNNLYAESFYEIGWLQKPGAETRPDIEIPSPADRTEGLSAEATAEFEKAERAFQQRDFETANRYLDQVEAAAPDDAASYNLRGEILVQQNHLERAEAMFEKALGLNPKFREAQYNLAQIPFKQGNYEKARDRFDALFASTPGDEGNQAAQLLRFKIYLTLLMQGKRIEARHLMDQFKFIDNTPALYYAHAAWEFKQGNNEEGADWVRSAERIYSPALNVVFLDSFYDFGWLNKDASSELTLTSGIAQPNASPQASPIMQLALANSVTPPDTAGQLNAGSSVAPIAGGASAITTPAASPVQPLMSATPASSPVSNATPRSVDSPSVETPVAAAPQRKKDERAAIPNTPATPATSKTVATEDEDTPAAEPSGLAQERDWTDIRETIGRAGDPKTLLIAALALTGIVLLVWMVARRPRRNLVAVPLEASPEPETERLFAEGEPGLNDAGDARPDQLPSQSPKPSLDVQPGEPAAATEPGASGAESQLRLDDLQERPEEPLDQEEVPDADKEEEAKPVTEAVIPLTAAVGPAAEERAPAEPIATTEKREEEPAGLQPVQTAQNQEPLTPATEEPAVAQGPPIPELTTALSAEAPIPELTQPEPKSPLELVEPESDLAAPVAGHRPTHSSIENPSFAPKIIFTEPIRLPPPTPITMPDTAFAPASGSNPLTASAPLSAQPPTESMLTLVQVIFSLEIASMQLTPTFQLQGLQLRPTSRVVSVRVAQSEDPQPPISPQVTFELTNIELSDGAIRTIRLTPSAQQNPAVFTSPTLSVSGLEVVSSRGSAPVQLTPSHQEQASVRLTLEFQIAAIEFTPLFEISAIVLNSTSSRGMMQLSGAGPTAIETAPFFQIEQVQLGPGNELGLIQVGPGMRRQARPSDDGAALT